MAKVVEWFEFNSAAKSWLIGLVCLIAMGLFVWGFTVGMIALRDSKPMGRCGSALPDSAVISAIKSDNGNILCKIIDADSVERSVWLDSDGEILR